VGRREGGGRRGEKEEREREGAYEIELQPPNGSELS